MNKTIGIIGCGNMGGGILTGIIEKKAADCTKVMVSDKSEALLAALKIQYGISTTTDNTKAAAFADILFLVVKPFLLEQVVSEIRDFVKPETVIISVAAGKTISYISELFGKEIKLIRIMPNLAALVGDSMTAYVPNEAVTADELAEAAQLFNSFGKAAQLTENLMDIFTAISGSAPAYICTMLDAMADAAVLGGVPRQTAYTIVEQAMLGTAKYLLETGTTPAALKDMVCTPGGTSIEAVAEIERLGVRPAIMSAVKVCADKSAALAKPSK